VPSPLLLLPFTLARHFLPSFPRSTTLAIIRAIEAAPFKDNRNGVKNTASFPLTLGAYSYWLLIKSLLPFKMKATKTTFILIDRHYYTSHNFLPIYSTAIALLRQLEIIYQFHLLAPSFNK